MRLQLVQFSIEQNCWDCKWCWHEGWCSNMSGHLALALAMALAPALWLCHLILGHANKIKLLIYCWHAQQQAVVQSRVYRAAKLATQNASHTHNTIEWAGSWPGYTRLDLDPGQLCKKCQLCHRHAPQICFQPQSGKQTKYFCCPLSMAQHIFARLKENWES